MSSGSAEKTAAPAETAANAPALKKFAVYKSKTGFYCYEYHDTLESLKGTMFENIITEEQLPVVMDGKGGYYHFRGEVDYNFVEIIESDKEDPLPLEKMYFKNDDDFKLGWMSPDGDTYSCDFTGHTKAAIMICKKYFPHARLPERTLGKAGWLKIIDSWDGTERQHGQFVYSLTGRLTNRQADRLFDLGLYNNPEVREMLGASENDW